ncbi:ATP-binding cassette domain-containing protein, partial [Candidatus Gracilibacteria bacterium]
MYCLKQIHIQNFRNIEYQTIYLGERKSVFVGKNGSGKTIILKAIEKLINSKRIKRKDFKDLEKKLILEATVIYNGEEIKIKIEAKFESDEITTVDNFSDEKQKEFLKKVNLIFIPADRKINKENKEDGYIKLIDLILKTKELKNDKLVSKAREKLSNLKSRDGATKTTILISLLRLYLFSIKNFKSDDFTIFLIDQPENFLHPHATKMIDEILQSIGEQENTKVCYATHSTEL